MWQTPRNAFDTAANVRATRQHTIRREAFLAKSRNGHFYYARAPLLHKRGWKILLGYMNRPQEVVRWKFLPRPRM